MNKTEQVRALIQQGDKKAALALAHTFRMGMTNEQRKAVKAAHEAHHFADFYRQCGKDPQGLIDAGFAVLCGLPFLQSK